MAQETGYERVSRLLNREQRVQHEAWQHVLRALQTVEQHLADANYGLARRDLQDLMQSVPHDAGPCRVTPLHDEIAERLAARDAAHSASSER